jgi:hypothetical protein
MSKCHDYLCWRRGCGWRKCFVCPMICRVVAHGGAPGARFDRQVAGNGGHWWAPPNDAVPRKGIGGADATQLADALRIYASVETLYFGDSCTYPLLPNSSFHPERYACAVF